MLKNKTKILIIDDNHSILEYLKTLLGRYNFQIKTSADGLEGLHGVAEFKPDIIFLDLMMPNIDGLQVLQLKKVLSDIKDIPVIVISANAGRNNVVAAIEAGADKVLAKPINVKQLKSAVTELLGEDLFDVERPKFEIDVEELVEQKKEAFNNKFDEYRNILIEAIKNRNSDLIKEIVVLLQDYAQDKSCFSNKKILIEIEARKYEKPSDWMFAEMKVKELEQNVSSKKIKQI